MTTKTEPKSTSKVAESTLNPTTSAPMTLGIDEMRTTDILDVNDTYSGSNDTSSGFNSILPFTESFGNISKENKSNSDGSLFVTTAAESSEIPATIAIEDTDAAGEEASSAAASSSSSSSVGSPASVKSRMSHNTADVLHKAGSEVVNVDKTVTADKEDSAERAESGVRNRSAWEENMLHDESAAEWVQLLLRTEFQKVLQQQAEEVLSLVSKHSTLVDTKLHDNQRRFSQLEERLAADIKNLDQMVSELKQELTSVTQGLHKLQSRTDKAEELEFTMDELRKNFSLEFNPEFNPRLLATLLDEQGKKIRKMERLTDIYKQSLEHYRNETKLEYRDLKDGLGKEGSVLRTLNQELYRNVTEHARHLSLQLNTSVTKQVEEAKQRLQVMEDNNLLLQIDLSSMERQIKSKTSKSEKDIIKLQADVDDINQRTRNMQKTLSTAVTTQDQMSSTVNVTSLEVKKMQMEVKLSLTDEWLPYNFEYMKTRTECFGEQYIKKSGFNSGRLVGVVLCPGKDRYKIFLGQGLTDTFKNIGDDSGMGEDHCQFVGARSMNKVKVSPFKTSTETEAGYVRAQWGQEPRSELLNIIRPSPVWYECGVAIP